MATLSTAALKRINQLSIQRAGPRYTPAIDPTAPNLEIEPLVSSIDALALSSAYRRRVRDLERELRSAWKKAPREIIELFNSESASLELGSILLKQLGKEKPGSSSGTLRKRRKALKTIQSRLHPYENDLYEQRIAEDSPNARSDIAGRLRDLQKLQSPVSSLEQFIESSDFALIQHNLMLLKGRWGTGKTHLLCDVALHRDRQSLPTLFLLGQSLPPKRDPLEAMCEIAGLGCTPVQLLSELDRLGRIADNRALLIVDGINEGDKRSWRRHMASIIRRVHRFRNVALVLSCRSPFDNQIFSGRSRTAFVETIHTGFEDIEFDAQKEFFDYYKIPTPHIPLLAPEFSRPLFLKIFCETIASFSRKTKSKRVSDFAAGQKGMTKLLEDFVSRIGRDIEDDYHLPHKTCWRLLKGQGEGLAAVGLSVQMAEKGRDYVYRSECLSITNQVTGLENNDAEAFLSRLVAGGLLVEHAVLEEDGWKDVFRLPYQRFSDHLISRHLLSQHLRTQSATAIRRSFYSNRPLGKIFKPARWGNEYEMPGLASAVMLEFPERVKRTLPNDERELVFYLPEASRAIHLMTPFVRGLLWRSSDSFTAQTDHVVTQLLERGDHEIQYEVLETFVCLASRTSHPYSAERLYRFLSRKRLVERDIFWSEFLRSRTTTSAVHRVLDWIITTEKDAVSEETANGLTWLCCLFLTSTVRTLRDRATRCLVILGERHPKILMECTAQTLSFDDPYVPERMLAACYGVLMRRWTSGLPELTTAAVELATTLYSKLRGSPSVAPLEHILMRDYAEGIIALAQKLSPKATSSLSLDGMRISRKSVIPNGSRIPEKIVDAASAAIHMDFENYTLGRLVESRGNYDFEHKEYRRVRRQVSWRIMNLGYDVERFKNIESSIASSNLHIGRSDDGTKIDRYGKKYSWIAFYEVAGRRSLDGKLADRLDPRISDTDIDPSFPERPLEWLPPVKPIFNTPYRSPANWMSYGSSPDYRRLLCRDEVDGVRGPWVLLQGYISETAPTDAREIFTFLRGLIVAPGDAEPLNTKLQATEYPGNSAIPDTGSDYYVFAGEIGCSPKYGSYLRGRNGRAKPQLRESFAGSKTWMIEKPYSKLTPSEKNRFALASHFDPENAFDSETVSGSQLVTLTKWARIPGITVELPAWHFAWESYHSEENKGGSPDYPAPSLVERLGLRKHGASVDLVDDQGQRAMLYREHGEPFVGFRSNLLYLRQDLLDKYLARRRRTLVWINWGERGLHYTETQRLRDTPAMRSAWDTHAHIHKQFVSYRR